VLRVFADCVIREASEHGSRRAALRRALDAPLAPFGAPHFRALSSQL
jgi:hypothetical protein